MENKTEAQQKYEQLDSTMQKIVNRLVKGRRIRTKDIPTYTHLSDIETMDLIELSYTLKKEGRIDVGNKRNEGNWIRKLGTCLLIAGLSSYLGAGYSFARTAQTTLYERHLKGIFYFDRLNEIQGQIYEIGIPRSIDELVIRDNLEAYAQEIKPFEPIYSEKIVQYKKLLEERRKLEEEHPLIKKTLNDLIEKDNSFSRNRFFVLVAGLLGAACGAILIPTSHAIQQRPKLLGGQHE